jgi:hypothetical protein
MFPLPLRNFSRGNIRPPEITARCSKCCYRSSGLRNGLKTGSNGLPLGWPNALPGAMICVLLFFRRPAPPASEPRSAQKPTGSPADVTERFSCIRRHRRLRPATGIVGPTTPSTTPSQATTTTPSAKTRRSCPRTPPRRRPVRQPQDLPHAQYCGHCHQEAYHQWRSRCTRTASAPPGT